MSSLMVDFIISLDGYAAGDGWPGFWGLEGPEYLGWLEDQAQHEHKALMGATTYRLMSGFAESGEAGLVDRFRVVVFPVITGATGKERIFDGYPDVALELVEHRTFDGRLQLLEYVPTVLDGPPDAGDRKSVV